ncbi:MAG: cyclase family protein [Chloroflexi bacterium]|nr:cyclase family protein [Chloroflexota bacterium]
MRVIDVSLPLSSRLTVFSGNTALSVHDVLRRDRGDATNVSELRIGTHAGTHVDAPSHLLDDAPGADRLPLDETDRRGSRGRLHGRAARDRCARPRGAGPSARAPTAPAPHPELGVLAQPGGRVSLGLRRARPRWRALADPPRRPAGRDRWAVDRAISDARPPDARRAPRGRDGDRRGPRP